MESMVVFHRCRSLAATDAFYIQQLGLKLWHTQPGCHIYDRGKPDPGHRLWLSGLCGKRGF